MAIFDDMIRNNSTPKKHSESHASFLNRVHTPYFDAIRQLVEDWFGHLDPDSQADMEARLKDNNDVNFCPAFWELYLHESLRTAGYRVTCHPEIPGTSRKPDFLAEGSDQSFYLEAKCLASGNNHKLAADKRKSQVYDAIQELDSPNFLLWVDVENIGPNTPSTRSLFRDLEAWLSDLDPDEIAQRLQTQPDREFLPSFLWEEQGWRIRFQPIAKAEHSRGKPGIPPIGVYDGAMDGVDDVTPLRKVLADKGSAYGKMDLPFVIAIITSFVGPDDEDIQDALYGKPQLLVARRGAMVAQTIRTTDGYWYQGTHWGHRNVSAVLIARDVYPGTATRVVSHLWEHPKPTYTIKCLPMWGSVAVDSERLSHTGPQQSVCEAFGLPNPWPTGRPFDPYPGP